MHSETEKLWLSCGIEPAFLTESAAWLGAPRELHGKALRQFEVAASLLRFAREDYKLGSAAFFHAVLGLERALRLHYGWDEATLQELLRRALKEDLIKDSLFGDIPAFTDWFDRSVRARIRPLPDSHSALLVALIPQLRNEYMHGEYVLAPDFVHLALQVRKIADQLTARITT